TPLPPPRHHVLQRKQAPPLAADQARLVALAIVDAVRRIDIRGELQPHRLLGRLDGLGIGTGAEVAVARRGVLVEPSVDALPDSLHPRCASAAERPSSAAGHSAQWLVITSVGPSAAAVGSGRN